MSACEVVLLYSIVDAAKQLGVGKTWLYDRVNAGEIRTVELGDKRSKQRIRADDLQAFIDARTFGASPSK